MQTSQTDNMYGRKTAAFVPENGSLAISFLSGRA